MVQSLDNGLRGKLSQGKSQSKRNAREINFSGISLAFLWNSPGSSYEEEDIGLEALI